ncbi:MAG: tetratricopeptide repeat protein [Streptosporangiaceae bacterium]
MNALGEIALATGQPGQAHTRYTAALDIAAQIGRRYEQARAHRGLGHSYLATGDQRQARHHWQQALALYAELGAPEAGQIRALVAAHDAHRRP